jgi:hypothetical protein
MHGWKYDESHSTDRVGVWIDDKKKEVHTIVRGTDVHNPDDLYQDGQVLMGGTPSATNDVKQALLKVTETYGEEYDLDTLGFSLGGTQLTDIFGQSNPAEDSSLSEFDSIVLVSPGGSPLNTTQIKKIMGDDRTTLLSNRSDIISQMYTANSNSASTSYYGEHTIYPTFAHGWQQYGSEFNQATDWPENGPIISDSAVLTAGAAYMGLGPVVGLLGEGAAAVVPEIAPVLEGMEEFGLGLD